MLLNYSIPDFRFLIGATDYGRYLAALAIALPVSEPEDSLIWTGEFELAYTLEAERAGLNFSEISAPGLWRPGMQAITLEIEGYTVAKLRIDNYHYDDATRVGKGRLSQVLGLIQGGKPEIEISTPQTVGGIIGDLLIGAFDSSVAAAGYIDLDFVTGDQIQTPLTSSNPASDAQRLIGVYWHWLRVNNDENIQAYQRPAGGSVAIRRGWRGAEVEPDLDNLNFAADTVVVTGARQYTRPYTPDPDEDALSEQEAGGAAEIAAELAGLPDPDPAGELDDDIPTPGDPDADRKLWTDDEGRPRKFVTITIGTLEEVFGLATEDIPAELGVTSVNSRGTKFVSQIKAVYYLHFDDQDREITENIWTEPLSQIAKIRSRFRKKAISALPPEPGEVVATVTAEFRAIAELLPDYEWRYPLQLIAGRVTVEGWDRKYEFIPLGQKVPDAVWTFPQEIVFLRGEILSQGINKIITKRATKFDPGDDPEDILTEEEEAELLAEGDRGFAIDPRTGKAIQLEKRPRRERRQLAPDVEILTETFRGVARLKPVGWNVFLPRTQTWSFEWLPSQGAADLLASRLAFREMARRDGIVGVMPIPLEWLAAGSPPFPALHYGNKAYLLEGLIVAIEEGRAEFRFKGELLGTIPEILDPPPPVPYTPGDDLYIRPIAGIVADIGATIGPIQLTAHGGEAPYTFSGTPPAGISLSSEGILSGTAAIAFNGQITVTVTDFLGAIASADITFIFSAPATPTALYSEVLEFLAAVEFVFEVAIGDPEALDLATIEAVFEVTTSDPEPLPFGEIEPIFEIEVTDPGGGYGG